MLHKKGAVLFLVLWTLSMLAVFAVVLSINVRQKMSLVNRLKDKDELRLMADGAVKKAMALVLEKDLETEEYSTLSDVWTENAALFKNIPAMRGMYNIYSERWNPLTQTVERRWGMTDEESKININVMDDTRLRQFFKKGLGYNDLDAQELAACLVDWRDADSQLSIPVGSAEDRDYRVKEYSYESKDAPFQVFEELRFVEKMDEDVYQKIKDYVTFWGSGKININTAPREVLLGLGLDDSTVGKILDFRLGEDQQIRTGDDGIFTNPSAIVSQLSQNAHLSPSEVAKLNIVADQDFVTYSRMFRIECYARLAGHKAVYRVSCVMDRRGKIYYWREG